MANLPTATYRLQLNPQFTFDDAISILEYLQALNVSHIYTSPYTQAVAGSTHGYDVADFSKVNKEIGGENGRVKFCAAIKKQHLAQVIDIVPNHMAAKTPDNILWTNLLKYGLSSPYTKYFDIYWQKSSKILLPVLEDHFDQVVKAGKIKINYTDEKFILQYYDQTFPLAADSIIPLLSKAAESAQSDLLDRIVKQLNNLPQQKYCEEAEDIEHELATLIKQSASSRHALEQTIHEYNDSTELLIKLHQAQNYQLVFWQTSLENTSYRRFFHLNSLIGVRVEDQQVFTATHKLILQWFQDSAIDGIRVDHIDGLCKPFQYLERLNKILPKKWMVVEKILSGGEKLPSNWPVAGTTGYEFLNLLTNVLLNSKSEAEFTDFYAKFSGEETDYHTVLREKKLLVLRKLLGAEVNFLTELLTQICKNYFDSNMFSCSVIHATLLELIASFPVYRTYIDPENHLVSKEDTEVILNAIKKTKKNPANIDSKLLSFLSDLLLLKHLGELENDFVLRFQQLTSPTMAKGGEDTALYCYNRFIALNDVGGNPKQFGISVEDFHQTMLAANSFYPHSMLTTSTHDTKRSEDIRARLVLLSEIGEKWFTIVKEWAAYNEEHHATNAPDRNTQYFLYQSLVGAWPIAKERFTAYMKKAVREAGTHTSWFFPSFTYEERLQNFIEDIFNDKNFCTSLTTFVKPLINPGRINSMSQVVLKLTAPGIPDIYQGSEIWNFTFVDPDNRLPVDFNLRRKLFNEMLSLSPMQVSQHMDDGMPKLWITYKILGLRKKHPNLFNASTYSPLFLDGEKKQHGIAFLRDEEVLVLVTRLPLTLNGNWGDTHLSLPKGNWQNILTNEKIQGEKIMISSLLKTFPVAVLLKN